MLHPPLQSFNTASGKYCCNTLMILLQQLASCRFNTASGKYCCNLPCITIHFGHLLRFNTASGKYCCNRDLLLSQIKQSRLVSIPQAVSTVATQLKVLVENVYMGFNTASGKYCCNRTNLVRRKYLIPISFNTASGKYCCNSGVWEASIYVVPNASFGKSQTVNGKFSSH